MMNFNFFSSFKWSKLPKAEANSSQSYIIVNLNPNPNPNPNSNSNPKTHPEAFSVAHSKIPDVASEPSTKIGFQDEKLGFVGNKGKREKTIKHVLGTVITFAFILLVIIALSRDILTSGKSESIPSSIEADIGVVAADERRCSIVGIDILKIGGNAVDAAVATCLCLGVLNPMASGIGGGAFMLIRMADGTTEVIDSREAAPLGAYEDMYNETGASSVKGGLSVAVPGELAGLHVAWQRYGRLPWNELFRPAIQFAEEGFQVSAYLAAALQSSSEDILSSPELASVFAPSGKLLRKDEICKCPKLANTLRQVAENGPSVFYDGFMSAPLANEIQEDGGILTVEDLRSYRPILREPLISENFGLTIIGPPPPSSGGATVIQILKILGGYPEKMASLGLLGLHRIVEAMKHSFALRMSLGDPEFIDNSLVLADMLSDDFANQIRANISDNTTYPPEFYGGRWNQLNDNGTAHFSVVDGERNAVSMTSTINLSFGAKFMSSSTGIILNNEMDDFSKPGEPNIFGIPPSKANFIRPNKRPLSSMAPVIVLQNGQVRAVGGGSGGPFIISATAQVLINHFFLGKSPLEAVEAPRVHHQLLPNQVYYESNHTLLDGENISFSQNSINFLISKNHNVSGISYGGVSQFISHNLDIPASEKKLDIFFSLFSSEYLLKHRVSGVAYGKLTAVSDPRKDGKPAGW